MSRSLRTRPMTLYAQDGHQPVIPAVPAASCSSSAYPHDPSYSRQQSASHHPRQDTSSAGPSSSSGGGSTPSVLRKSKKKASEVGSNLKKRLSMRYAEPTQLGPGGFSAVPAVPSLPPMPQIHIDDRPHHHTDGRYLATIAESSSDAAYDPDDNELQAMRKSSETAHTQTDVFEHDPAVDLQLLSQSEFDPQAYLRAKLSHHTESSLRSFKSSLAAAKQAANDDIKRQVFKNYSEFITISKEIATLENDMLELKELLSEWKQLPHALELDDSTTAASFSDFSSRTKPTGKSNRNSTVDVQHIYRAQITSLWEGIEGSQKFLPYIPGRHLIAEASSFTELNAATYKPQQSVALFLLDDLLLIATRRKRQMSSKVRLVAERCLSLAEIVVIDLKDGGELTNAIKIKRARESYVYRTDRAQDKRALLNAFRRVAEELAKKRRNESEYGATVGARKRESTLLSSPRVAQHQFDALHGGGGGSPSGRVHDGGLLTSIGEDGSEEGTGGVMAAAAASAASERKDPGRWNNDFADQLSVCIAVREWDQAVTLIEKGRAVLSTYTSSTDTACLDLSSKLSTQTVDLIGAISSDFVRHHLKKSSVIRNASYLLRLDQGEKARQLFLDSRTQLLKKRTRQIKFEGDTALYISELGMVHFPLIRNTSEWYVAAFKDGSMASGFVQWAWERVEEYAQLFRTQVYGVEHQTEHEQMVNELKHISLRLAAQLNHVGLDFSFLLQLLLQPEPALVSAQHVQNLISSGMDASAQGGAPIPKLVLTRSSRIGMEGEQTSRERHTPRGEVTSAQELRRQSMLHLS